MKEWCCFSHSTPVAVSLSLLQTTINSKSLTYSTAVLEGMTPKYRRGAMLEMWDTTTKRQPLDEWTHLGFRNIEKYAVITGCILCAAL